ncbi:MAG TPA: hypothetical protein VKT81_17980 [Bryobacteraceae bacterium]|nr:hypothetical protein [Bryobacteraceae bacterium]
MEEVTASAAWKSKLSRLDPGVLVLLLLPWLVLIFSSAWIYNAFVGIDQWIYFGYFLNYPRYVSEWFPDRYYGTRLPWVLPGYVLHALFDPKTARYVLHLGFYYIAVFSLYGLLRRAIGSRAALLASVLFGTYSFFLGAIGWDYVDGAGLTYNLLALLCLDRAANSKCPRLWLVASGTAVAAMFYCNAFLVVFLPVLPIFYLYQVHQGFTRPTLFAMLRLALWGGVGVLLTTVALGTVNYAVGGGFWFYAPSLDFVRSHTSKTNPFFAPGWHWAVRATWLQLPLIALIASSLYVVVGRLRRTFGPRDLRLFFALQYLTYAGIMMAWHLSGGMGLQGYYYNSYVIPSAFLAIGCVLATRFEGWPASVYWLFLLAVCLAFAASFKLTYLGLAVRIREFGWFPIGMVMGIGLVLYSMTRRRWPVLLLILSCLWLCQVVFRMDFPPEKSGAADLARVVESAKLVRAHTGADPLKFWYNANEPLGAEFNAIHSVYLWSWSMVSRDLPAILPAYPVKMGDSGVILTSRDDALERANRALSPLNLEARLFGTGKIDRDNVQYRLLFFRLAAPGTAEEIPLTLTAAGAAAMKLDPSPSSEAGLFPIQQWIYCKYPLTDGHMDVRPDGVHVTTHAGRYSYAAKFGPIAAVRSGIYRFVLEYEHLDGALRFGALSGDETHWLVQPSAAERHGGNGTREAYAPLTAGEQAFLMVGNNVGGGPEHSSTFVIKSLRAYAAFSK